HRVVCALGAGTVWSAPCGRARFGWRTGGGRGVDKHLWPIAVRAGAIRTGVIMTGVVPPGAIRPRVM
ncbi:MAG: hypothetical protein AAF317_08010, partial [Pseudomonadota bacterium]